MDDAALKNTIETLYKIAKKRDYDALLNMQLDNEFWVWPDDLDKDAKQKWRKLIQEITNCKHKNDTLFFIQLCCMGLVLTTHQVSELRDITNKKPPTPLWWFVTQIIIENQSSKVLENANDHGPAKTEAQNLLISKALESLIHTGEVEDFERLRQDKKFKMSNDTVFYRAATFQVVPFLSHILTKLTDDEREYVLDTAFYNASKHGRPTTIAFLFDQGEMPDDDTMEELAQANLSKEAWMKILRLQFFLKHPQNFMRVVDALRDAPNIEDLRKHIRSVMSIGLLRQKKSQPT